MRAGGEGPKDTLFPLPLAYLQTWTGREASEVQKCVEMSDALMTSSISLLLFQAVSDEKSVIPLNL